MKRSTRVLAVIAALIGSPPGATAADMPVKAPPKPIADNWSGFYAGAHFGYGWRQADFWDRVSLLTGATFEPFSYDTKGAFGGAQVGYNFLSAPRTVLGIEADLSIANIRGSAFNPGSGNSIRTTSAIHWFGTMRGRAGYVFDNVLVFGTAGLAVINAHVMREQLSGTAGLATAGTVETASWIRPGWTAGGGIEMALVPRWSVKAEYLYVASFQNVTWTPPLAQARRTMNIETHTARVGMNHRF